MSKRVLITGITGQDGSYLADILLEKGHEVHGLYRHSSCDNLTRIRHCLDRLELHKGDIVDMNSVASAIRNSDPDELYHMADQDSVGWSVKCPVHQIDVTYGGTQNVLEAIRTNAPACRVFIPVSATMFGNAFPRQDEDSPIDPQSPYACAKAACYHLARYYRRAYEMFVSCGIMYNHDSPRRGPDYLLQKICRAASRASTLSPLVIGNLELEVDIGYARDYMKIATNIIQLKKPDDFIVATGFGYKISHMIQLAYGYMGVSDYHTYLIQEADRKNQPVLIGNNFKLCSMLDARFTSLPDLVYRLMDHLTGKVKEDCQ